LTGNRMADHILIFLSLASALVLTGVFVYTDVLYQRPVIDDLEEKIKLLQDVKKEDLSRDGLKLEHLIVNVKSDTVRLRFLDTTMILIPFKPSYIEILEKQRSSIYDSIIGVASNTPAEELNSVSGKILFENRVKKKINDLVGADIIREIFFTTFVVQ